LIRPAARLVKRYICQAVDYWWDDENEKQKIMDAYRTWEQAQDRHWVRVFDEEKHSRKSLWKAAEQAQPQDVILWADRFTPYPSDIAERARAAIESHEYARFGDIHAFNAVFLQKQLSLLKGHHHANSESYAS
jgi:hypothetical protein